MFIVVFKVLMFGNSSDDVMVFNFVDDDVIVYGILIEEVLNEISLVDLSNLFFIFLLFDVKIMCLIDVVVEFKRR